LQFYPCVGYSYSHTGSQGGSQKLRTRSVAIAVAHCRPGQASSLTVCAQLAHFRATSVGISKQLETSYLSTGCHFLDSMENKSSKAASRTNYASQIRVWVTRLLRKPRGLTKKKVSLQPNFDTSSKWVVHDVTSTSSSSDSLSMFTFASESVSTGIHPGETTWRSRTSSEKRAALQSKPVVDSSQNRADVPVTLASCPTNSVGTFRRLRKQASKSTTRNRFELEKIKLPGRASRHSHGDTQENSLRGSAQIPYFQTSRCVKPVDPRDSVVEIDIADVKVLFKHANADYQFDEAEDILSEAFRREDESFMQPKTVNSSTYFSDDLTSFLGFGNSTVSSSSSAGRRVWGLPSFSHLTQLPKRKGMRGKW
jgi:hypothetical protein